MIHQLPSGLLIAESEKPPESPKPEPKYRCAVCGKASVDNGPLLFACRTEDWFRRHQPTCRHPDYLTCPDCVGKGCPVCGDTCEYT